MIIIAIINKQINKQITNIQSNTTDSDSHCKKYKNFTQFLSEEIPKKCTVADPWANRSTGKPGKTFSFCAMNKYKMYINNLKKYKIYIIFQIYCRKVM